MRITNENLREIKITEKINTLNILDFPEKTEFSNPIKPEEKELYKKNLIKIATFLAENLDLTPLTKEEIEEPHLFFIRGGKDTRKIFNEADTPRKMVELVNDLVKKSSSTKTEQDKRKNGLIKKYGKKDKRNETKKEVVYKKMSSYHKDTLLQYQKTYKNIKQNSKIKDVDKKDAVLLDLKNEYETYLKKYHNSLVSEKREELKQKGLNDEEIEKELEKINFDFTKKEIGEIEKTEKNSIKKIIDPFKDKDFMEAFSSGTWDKFVKENPKKALSFRDFLEKEGRSGTFFKFLNDAIENKKQENNIDTDIKDESNELEAQEDKEIIELEEDIKKLSQALKSQKEKIEFLKKQLALINEQIEEYEIKTTEEDSVVKDPNLEHKGDEPEEKEEIQELQDDEVSFSEIKEDEISDKQIPKQENSENKIKITDIYSLFKEVGLLEEDNSPKTGIFINKSSHERTDLELKEFLGKGLTSFNTNQIVREKGKEQGYQKNDDYIELTENKCNNIYKSILKELDKRKNTETRTFKNGLDFAKKFLETIQTEKSKKYISLIEDMIKLTEKNEEEIEKLKEEYEKTNNDDFKLKNHNLRKKHTDYYSTINMFNTLNDGGLF